MLVERTRIKRIAPGSASWTQLRRLALLVCLLLSPAPRASAELTFTIGGSWDSEARRTAATNAMQTVVDRYNAFAPNGFDNRDVYVYYSSGIPTAQASYHGSIGFGGTWPAERVTAHEMAHYLGLPSGNWNSLIAGGWSGPQASALVRQFDGDQAVLNGDSIHFWPYGLNFDSEGGELNQQRQVAMVYAMRADLGIGPAAHPSPSTNVQLIGNDPVGTSSFNYQEQWSDGYFAHGNANYTVSNNILRTPASSNSFTFAGRTLTLQNTNGASGGMFYEGTGNSAIVTVNALRLDGGWIQHTNGVNNLFQLDGRVFVTKDSVIRAKEGNIDLLADLSGNGNLILETTDLINEDNRYVRFKSSNNTFKGNLINKARFELAEGANFLFDIGATGENNVIAGSTARATLLNGDFEFDLRDASNGPTDNWTLVTAANTTYGPTFKIPGFYNSAGIWGDGTYAFSQLTGVLSPVTNWAVDGGGNWNDAAHWTSGIPIAGGEATFGNALTGANAPATVQLDLPITLRRLTFDNPNRYVLSGSNSLTLSGGAQLLVPQGSHELAVPVGGSSGLHVTGGGTVTLSALNTYSGDTIVEQGTLALAGTASLANSSNIHIRSGANFNVSGLSSTFGLGAGQTLQGESGGTVTGDVVAASSSLVTGTGTFQNRLELQSGATLRIGGAGMPVSSGPMLIDNFDSYNNTTTQTIGAHSSGDITGGKWDGIFDGTGNARIVDDATPNDNSIQVNGVDPQPSPWRGTVTDLANNFETDFSLADGDTATYFFQFYREGNGDIDGIFGLADGPATIDTADPWNDYAVLASVFGNSPGSTDLRAYSQGAGDVVVIDNISHQTWYNVWLVVDNATKTYDIYTSTGTDDANPGDPSTFKTNLNFGRDTSVLSLEQFGLNERLSNNSPSDGAIRIDNIYMAAGENIANPLTGSGFIYSPEVLTVLGDLKLEAGATLIFDIADAGINDVLDIGGTLSAAGTLEVLLASSAPTPTLGDSFDLLDFTVAEGEFDSFNLPGLDAGLAWNVSQLVTTGEVTVVVDVDLNDDGYVNGGDFLILQQSDPALLSTWQSLYGSRLVSSIATAVAVPEPTSCSLLCLAVATLLGRWRRC